MKRIITFLFFVVLFSVILQAQSGFSYQAVLRNDDGSLRANESLILNVELVHDTGTVYTESHMVTTNDFGVFTIIVGEGSGEQTYSSGIFLSNDSSYVPETYLRVTESGGGVISETKISGVPVAEVAKVALKAEVGFPAGAIIPFAGKVEKIPKGWLLCDGTAYQVADYPELYDAIGTNWGSPGLDEFNVPDLRGVFLRGANYGSADGFTDPDRDTRISRKPGGNIGDQVGSYQDDEFKSHTHSPAVLFIIDGHNGRYGGGEWGNFSGATVVNNSGGNETRPQNAYVNYIIKY